MAEEDTPSEGAQTPQAEDFKPIESQEALDRIVEGRVSRERHKYSDYDALKAKAAKFW